jgi:hypothetical protein
MIYDDIMIDDPEKQQMEYNKIAKIINDKFGCDLNARNTRQEMCDAVNKLFLKMVDDEPKRIFDILAVMCEEFKIKEERLIGYLNDRNYMIVRNFAMNNYETTYYEKCERRKINEKSKKKGEKISFDRKNIDDLFE